MRKRLLDELGVASYLSKPLLRHPLGPLLPSDARPEQESEAVGEGRGDRPDQHLSAAREQHVPAGEQRYRSPDPEEAGYARQGARDDRRPSFEEEEREDRHYRPNAE